MYCNLSYRGYVIPFITVEGQNLVPSASSIAKKPRIYGYQVYPPGARFTIITLFTKLFTITYQFVPFKFFFVL